MSIAQCGTLLLTKFVYSSQRNNIRNRYAIAAMKLLPGTIAPSIIGHFPKEISQLTYFIMNRGAMVVSVHYRQLPLIQGGLKIYTCGNRCANAIQR